MSPVSSLFQTVETVKIALKFRNVEHYPHKRRAEISMLGSCLFIFPYINTVKQFKTATSKYILFSPYSL